MVDGDRRVAGRGKTEEVGDVVSSGEMVQNTCEEEMRGRLFIVLSFH